MCHLSSNTVHSRILSPYSPSCQVYLNTVPVFPHGGVRLQNRKSKVELSVKSLPSLLFSYVKLLFLKHTSRAVGLSYTITMAEDCCSFQLISGAGVLNVEGLENFTRTTNLAQRRLSYAAVAIIGPQRKSTLLNQLFRTDFTMMDAYEGRGQTTQGIWIGKGIGIEPFTIAMDVEGSDSSERGQDGTTTFEKRSALFALAIADIVIINMWCHDIGREHAASRPLLKTVFEAMTRLFGARKTTLLFVLRDQTPTPLARLENILRRDIDQIWAAAAKTKALGWNLGDYFNVEIIALPNYVHEKERFNEQVALLRQRFIDSISPGGLVGDRKDVQPASGFSLRAEQIWKTIKENKDLDLPALEVMVATFRCEQIAKEKLSRLKLDETWLAMRKALKSGPVSEFGKKLSSILENYLSPYDMETMGYEERIRKDRRQRLETEALEAVYPAYAAMLQHLRSIALKSFKTKLEKTVTEKRGDGFKAFVDSCGRSIMLEFKKGCEDATIKKRVSGWVAGEANVKEKLQLEIENLKSDKKAEYEAEGKKIQKEKIKKGVTTSAGVVAGVTVGAALTLVSDPVTAAATGLGVSAATIQLIDVVRDVVRRRS
ncbi:protein ROOT HAIR DEFECTIVE 3 [Populus alba x Populus x berolinensis]|uniref:Protein ROOT HAIR DEFECTIVE 3 n=1 Tax=Populus alba x Populus x berolinensis TaxID=444605 RepID=A0AAD6M374_9ROSI|nr:protein ROOT HAIR DEFECTIVE 3 [Populus alba x Populus x berolinensis]